MRLLLLGLNFTPELTGIGKYSGEMAEWLAARGHEVRVVTAPPYYPAWRVSEGHHQWRYRREVSPAGVRIYRCPLWVPKRPTGLKRILHLTSFAISSLPVMLRQAAWRPDLVLAVEPAFVCTTAALLVARLCGAPAWLHIQDFEIDAAFDLGLLPSGGFIQWAAKRYEHFFRSRFSQFSTISRGMMQRLRQKGIKATQTVFFPNWVDVDAIRPDDEACLLRERLGIRDDQVVLLYSGNMGMKQGLEILPELASGLRSYNHLHFVFCGDGAYRPELEEAVAGFENVSLLPLQPVDRFNELLNMADIHLLPQKAGAADLVMPSKLTGMLASGRPVIATAAPGTQVARAIEGHGLAIAPGNTRALFEAIVALANDAPLRRNMGLAARAFAEQELARDSVLLRFESAIERMFEETAVTAIAENSAL